MFLPVLAFLGSHSLARVADQGLANSLGLVTLRHGTNPLSWIGIHILGAQPKMGNSRIGGDYGCNCDYQNINRFYFAQDTDYYEYNFNRPKFKVPLNKLMMRYIPRVYSYSSTVNLFKSIGMHYRIVNLALGILGASLPTIKFR